MCPGTESAPCCCAVTREAEADVCVQRLCVFFCLVAAPFGLMLSTVIAYLQPKPTGRVKITSNRHNKEYRLLDPEIDLGDQQLSSREFCLVSWPSASGLIFGRLLEDRRLKSTFPEDVTNQCRAEHSVGIL